MLTKESCLFHKPADVSFDAAALTEPLSGAWKGVIQYSEMKVGDDVVVIGVGGIGLLCLMVARAAGAGRLIAVDTSPYALAQALKLGATHAVDARDPDVKKRVYDIIPDGPDLVVEAAGPDRGRQADGRPAAPRHAMERLRHHHARDVRAGRRPDPLPRRPHGRQLRHHAAGHAEGHPPDGDRAGGSREDHLPPLPAPATFTRPWR